MITLAAQEAVKPAGKFVAAPIPVAPVVVCVILLRIELIQSVSVEDASVAEQVWPKMGPVKTPIDKNSRKKSLYFSIRMKLKAQV